MKDAVLFLTLHSTNRLFSRNIYIENKYKCFVYVVEKKITFTL